ncbi:MULTISPECIES: hypothetical protein [unclassified Mesorhizobium]|uniref:hypothetical protein n=1 Tax=unclassified Mesorhizobium TaxID=325217 RepID=UPI00112D8660|nr:MULTISPECIES: hypothetical protein [unclassified Mesorhizobium]TPI14642.1 hypothetical protein FJW10_25035 [Mesorhizobium sp. B4-1-1]TPL51256.1 hypothetical protein FJ957_06575 [Mesorhizobium sp. B2-4-6]
MPDGRSRFHSVASRAWLRAHDAYAPLAEAAKQKAVNWNNCRRSPSGSAISHAIVLAMRYVIVIAAIAFFLIWDGLYNHGRYLDVTVREVSRIVRYVTG